MPTYLDVHGIGTVLFYMSIRFASICKIITLPESSHEGRTIRAIEIAKGSTSNKHGVLFIAGVHARELINPDLVLSFAWKLCQAYVTNTGLVFGGRTYSSSSVKLIVDNLDIFIVPLVNPDGRVYVQAPGGDRWWRKNRNSNPGAPCVGVDLNRNFDFLWNSGIGTSTYSCSEVFRGIAAFSEPETRNVRHLLDTFPNIRSMIDVHSYSELILYPWGDDDNQSTNLSMNFRNPAYDGLRGIPGDGIYREYIPQNDWDWYIRTGNRIRDAIAAVRGRFYTVQQSVRLYPTSGTSKDYAYGRHFVDTGKRRVLAFTLETWNGASENPFQPDYAEALNVISEVSSGLVEFCLASICVVEETVRGTRTFNELVDMRAFRDEELLNSKAGTGYVKILEENIDEILGLIKDDKKLHSQTIRIIVDVNKVITSSSAAEAKRKQKTSPSSMVLDSNLIKSIEDLLEAFKKNASPKLRNSIEKASTHLKYYRNKTLKEGLKTASSYY